MRRGGSKPGERRGGRPPGGRNKATIEKERQAPLIGEGTVMDARGRGQKLGKDVLEDFMNLFASMAAHHQPAPPGHLPNQNEDKAEFYRNAEFAIDCAAKLASYQSPTFKAIMVAPPPPPPPAPPTIDGEVVRIDDPVVLGNIYRRMVTAVRKKA